MYSSAAIWLGWGVYEAAWLWKSAHSLAFSLATAAAVICCAHMALRACFDVLLVDVARGSRDFVHAWQKAGAYMQIIELG